MEDDPRRPLKVVIFLAVAMAAFVGIRKWFAPAESVPWRTDLDSARVEAAQAGKPVLLYFTADWCGPCQKMKQTTWSDPQVTDVLRAYVPVKIDVDAKGDVARRFGVRSIPRVQLMTPDGKPGQARSGYVTSADMVQWLR